MVILPADIKSIKDIIRDDIFPSLLGLRLDDLSKISCPFSANSFPFGPHPVSTGHPVKRGAHHRSRFTKPF
jgi:hypothetical protein